MVEDADNGTAAGPEAPGDGSEAVSAGRVALSATSAAGGVSAGRAKAESGGGA
jgi:hypothetical protein